MLWCQDSNVNTLYFINSSTSYTDVNSASENEKYYEGHTILGAWRGTQVTNSGANFPAWCSDAQNVTKVVFDESFASVKPTNCHRWFSGFLSLTTIEGLQYLNTSEVTDMSNMFINCGALTSVDVSTFDVRKVTNISQMFDYCDNLTTIYCNDTWTINNGSGQMFADCSNLKGAVSYDANHIASNMANPTTG